MKTRIYLLVCMLLLPGAVWGQACSYSVSPTLDFGSITGLPTPQIDVTADITVQCPLLSSLSYRICIGIPVGSGGNTIADRRLANGGYDLSFNLYRDAARSQVWGSVASGQNVQLDFLAPLGYSTTVTVYGRVFGGTSGISVGNYQSLFNNIEVREDTYLILFPTPCGSLSVDTNLSTTAQLNIEPDCTITATALGFGVVNEIIQTDASTNLSVTCTLNGAYSVSLNGGTNTGDVNNRQMQLGGASIDYQLYRNAARNQVWGDTVGTTVSGTGNGSPQSLTVYGRVPAQGPKPSGTYQDTVTATVMF